MLKNAWQNDQHGADEAAKRRKTCGKVVSFVTESCSGLACFTTLRTNPHTFQGSNKGKRSMAASSTQAPSKGEILNAAAEATGLSRKQVAAVFESLAMQIGNALWARRGAGSFTVPGLMKINVISKPASPRLPQGDQPLHEGRADVQGQAGTQGREGSPAQEPEGHGQVNSPVRVRE